MGSGTSSAYRLSKEEAAALDNAVSEAPSLKHKLERLQAELEKGSKSPQAEVEEAAASEQADLQNCLDRLEEQKHERRKLEVMLRAVERELPDSTAPKDEVTALLEDLASQSSANVRAKEQVKARLGDLKVPSSSPAHEVPPCKEEQKSQEPPPEESAAEASRPSEDPVLKEEIARLKLELSQKEEVIKLQQEKLVQEEDKTAAETCRDILEAARKGNAAALRHFLRIRPHSVKSVDLDGWTALHYAARGGHATVAELLLAAGVALDATTKDGWTALHTAALNGHAELVEKLLAAGASIAADRDGETALHKAALGGHSSMVEQLLSAGTAVDAADKDGRTALHWAAREGHIDVVKKLLSAGAALDAATTKGQKPYHLAKQEGHSEVMAVLHRVWVTLMSGRKCHCDPSQDRTISELKDEAESKLGVIITSLVGPDNQPLKDLSKTLAAADIQPGITLAAVILAVDELSPNEFASLELPKEGRIQSPYIAELHQMKRDAMRISSLVAEVACGVLLIYSGREAKPMIQAVESEDSEEMPEIPEDHEACEKVFKLLPEKVTFGEPVRLVVPLETGANIAMRSSAGFWEAVHTSCGTRHAEVSLDHFCLLRFFRRLIGRSQPEYQMFTALAQSAPSIPASLPTSTCGTHRRHILLSGRFNTPQRTAFMKAVKEALITRQVSVDMVDVTAGESFAMPTMAGLYYAKVLAAFCTEDYGQQTGARYETFWELRYAWEKSLMILPIRLCNDFPPKPPGEAGKIQNDFILSCSTIRIDGRNQPVEVLADMLAEAWRRLP